MTTAPHSPSAPHITGSKEVQLVDAAGITIGTQDVFAAHRHPAQLHRAPSVWLINSTGQVLLQQRSHHKILGAGWWANTVCGNVKPDETAQECAYRRLREELGIVSTAAYPVRLTELYTFTYKAYCNETYGEYEYDHVFVGQYDEPPTTPITPNPHEVAQIAWVDAASLRSAAQALSYPTAAQTVAFSETELKAQTGAVELNIATTPALTTFCPWTVMMLRDDRLILPFTATLS
jgi:isopentenyl-diphosphate delta-isomerase